VREPTLLLSPPYRTLDDTFVSMTQVFLVALAGLAVAAMASTSSMLSGGCCRSGRRLARTRSCVSDLPRVSFVQARAAASFRQQSCATARGARRTKCVPATNARVWQVGEQRCIDEGCGRCTGESTGDTCARHACAHVPAGYGDCDHNAVNGYEVHLNTDASHCGTCAKVCALPNAVANCTTGTCVVKTCSAGDLPGAFGAAAAPNPRTCRCPAVHFLGCLLSELQ
jgi:hypothetical protein